jgi:hypothetical protein
MITCQSVSLSEFTMDLFLELPEVAGNEKDYRVVGNLITITFGSEYGDFKLSVAVSFDDTPKSIHERFVQLLSDHIGEIRAMEEWDADNYEHPIHTQGRAFDRLTA